jgi:hypothetical protein
MKGCMRHLLWLGFVATLACGRTEPEPPAGAPEAAAPEATPAAPAAASAAAAALPLPPEGRWEVSFDSEGILALANQAPRRRLLEALARETGLVVVAFVDGGDPDGRVTLQSRGEPIEVVLARALSGVPYSVEPLPTGVRERLAVVVGKRDPAGRPQPRPAAPLAESRERMPRTPAPSDTDALAQLESADPQERVEGVEWADVASAAGFAAVVERLTNDPDASVRAAAAESLGDADVGAIPPLVHALADADARVVLAALESLEMLGDASTVAELAPALEHPDAAVRQRAAEVAEFLE